MNKDVDRRELAIDRGGTAGAGVPASSTVWRRRLLTRYVLPLVIVVVPADFQVNAVLCDSMRRRMGYTPEQIDLELPQRRLREFAEAHGVLLIDLLPEFKADGAKLYVRHQSRWNQRGNTKAARSSN